jgi:hypothetical protein
MGAVSRLGTFGLWLVTGALALACGTDAEGVDACKQIEAARCRAASSCGVAIDSPYTTVGTSVDACIRTYDVACLHGLVVGSDPGTAAVNACVAAIGDHPCSPGGPNLVESPEKDPKCAWLAPPPAEAGSAADATGGAGDAADASADAPPQ